MEFDAALSQDLSLVEVGDRAQGMEELGFDGAWMGEARHDVAVPLTLAIDRTSAMRITAGVAVAFARNPVSLAYTAHDLQALSGGRFVLGIGSQTKPHIERRFGMPWSAPVERMREFIAVMRAAWACWDDGVRLEYRGNHYQVDLMTEMFSPPRQPFGPPRVHLACVGPQMTRLAAEVADGLITHPFGTGRSLAEVTGPLIAEGLSRSGRSRDEIEVTCQVLAVSGPTDEAWESSRAAARSTIAFYASTPAYRRVLELHGLEQLGEELHRLSREHRWTEMAGLIEDDVLEIFAVVAPPAELGSKVCERFDGIAERITLADTVRGFTDETWAQVIGGVHQSRGTPPRLRAAT